MDKIVKVLRGKAIIWVSLLTLVVGATAGYFIGKSQGAATQEKNFQQQMQNRFGSRAGGFGGNSNSDSNSDANTGATTGTSGNGASDSSGDTATSNIDTSTAAMAV
ncbi:MAG: hypothetical protein FWH31_06635 [Streptococcaceae bacterium]|nr:hypothetical protein [Streptococcaceae bacterium]